MKKLSILLLTVFFTLSMSAQELDSLKSIMDNKHEPSRTEERSQTKSPDSDTWLPVIVEEDDDGVNVRVMEKEVVKVIEDGDSTYVKIGDKGMIQILDHPDSTSIRVGDKEIRIVENNSNTRIKFGDYHDREVRIKNPKFRGHWAGFEWGINNFLDTDNELSHEDMADLNTGRSWVINLNFAQYSLGFGTSHIGLVTGLGLEMNNYFFDEDITIIEFGDYVIADPLSGNVMKSKLTTTYLRIPVLLEVQFPNTVRSKRVFLSGGIVAGLKLGSHTKVVYDDDGGKNKDKNRDDFNINPFKYGLTARIGFGNISFFGDYYISTMFVKDKGPELHPFSLGLAMNF